MKACRQQHDTALVTSGVLKHSGEVRVASCLAACPPPPTCTSSCSLRGLPLLPLLLGPSRAPPGESREAVLLLSPLNQLNQPCWLLLLGGSPRCAMLLLVLVRLLLSSRPRLEDPHPNGNSSSSSSSKRQRLWCQEGGDRLMWGDKPCCVCW
jgi:hypothetical protein